MSKVASAVACPGVSSCRESRVEHGVAARRWTFAWTAFQTAATEIIDRLCARIAFHNSRRYRALLNSLFDDSRRHLLPQIGIARIRKLDPGGLGIWLLSRAGQQPQLEQICRRAFALPGIGPPRPIGRMLDRAWSGKRACWFGRPDGFDALLAETLINGAQASTLIAAELAWNASDPPLSRAIDQLTRTANAVQAAASAHQRVIQQPIATAQETARWAFQAVNVLRRAINRTDPSAVDEQLAREAARQAISAATSACAAAIELSGRTGPRRADPAIHAARDKLAALARTADALASRVVSSLRSEATSPSAQQEIIDQSGRVLRDAVKALRPWNIELPCAPAQEKLNDPHDLVVRANELAEASVDVLECWSTLHQLAGPQDGTEGSNPSPRGAIPAWADRLIRTSSGNWNCQEIMSSLHIVSLASEPSVPDAVAITALPTGTLKLHRELWRLIRNPRCSAIERSLAFQLFCRLIIN